MERLSDQVAQRCRESVLERVLPQIANMTAAEARGYIRARASRGVVLHTALLLAELGAPEEVGPRLAALAKRRLVAYVMAELRKPGRPAGLRRKAA